MCFFERYFYLSDFHIINHIINLGWSPGGSSDAASRKIFFCIFLLSWWKKREKPLGAKKFQLLVYMGQPTDVWTGLSLLLNFLQLTLYSWTLHMSSKQRGAKGCVVHQITCRVLSRGRSKVIYSTILIDLSLIHIWRCRRLLTCRSRWSPYH